MNYLYRDILDMGLTLEREYSPPKVCDGLCKELVELGNALVKNIARIGSLAVLPAWLVEESQKMRHAADRILLRHCGTLEARPSVDFSNADLMKERILLSSQEPKDLEKSADSIDYVHGSENLISWVRGPTLFAAGADNFTNLISLIREPWPRTATSYLYSSLILGAYTAFEALATDLWLVSLNLRPKSLVKNMLLAHTTPRNEDSTSRGQEPSIRFSDLSEYDFNVSAVMGKLLKEQRRANFDSLYGIRLAYESAFRLPEDKKKHRTSEELKHLFTSSHSDLRCLESLRNLIAHRGGVVDEKFRREVEKTAPDLYTTHQGEMLQLNGQQVSKYVMAAVQFSLLLLHFVDKWLAKYPE